MEMACNLKKKTEPIIVHKGIMVCFPFFKRRKLDLTINFIPISDVSFVRLHFVSVKENSVWAVWFLGLFTYTSFKRGLVLRLTKTG